VGLLDEEAYFSYMSPFVSGTLNDPYFTSVWIQAVNQGSVQPAFVEEIDRLREQLRQPAFDPIVDVDHDKLASTILSCVSSEKVQPLCSQSRSTMSRPRPYP